MNTKTTPQPRQTSLAWSALLGATGAFSFGFLGWLWLFSAHDLAWRAVALVAVLALAELVGSAGYLCRVRADRRWRAALECYADQEEAMRTEKLRERARQAGTVQPPAGLSRLRSRPRGGLPETAFHS